MNMTWLHKTFCIGLLLIITSFGCDILISSAGGEVPDGEVIPDNPRDPDNPTATLPSISLNDGFSFDQVFEVNSKTITLTWEPSTDGLQTDLSYRYKIASPNEVLANISYSSILTTPSVTFSNLQESISGETYSFQIEVSSATNTSLAPLEFSGSFRVNAFQSQAFIFNPNTINNNGDGTYTAKLFIDEIQSTDNLAALKLDIIFDSSLFSVSESEITVYEDARSFLYNSNVEFITFTKVVGDTVRIETGITNSSLQSFSGGGAIGEVLFTTNQSSWNSSTISISSSSVLKNSDGQDISIIETDSAIIEEF
tara:strand:+ start:27408 stop:28340 length:933 start_codon:yes stop_codon:yes gene_type:complete